MPLFFQESTGGESVIYITRTIIFVLEKTKTPYRTQNSMIGIGIVTVVTFSPRTASRRDHAGF